MLISRLCFIPLPLRRTSSERWASNPASNWSFSREEDPCITRMFISKCAKQGLQRSAWSETNFGLFQVYQVPNARILRPIGSSIPGGCFWGVGSPVHGAASRCPRKTFSPDKDWLGSCPPTSRSSPFWISASKTNVSSFSESVSVIPPQMFDRGSTFHL